MHDDHLVRRAARTRTPGVERSVHRCARVDNQDVAGAKELWQIPKRGMPNGIIIRVGDEEPNAVSRKPSRFRRLMSHERLGELEVEQFERSARVDLPTLQRERDGHAATGSPAPATGASSEAT